MKHLRAALGDIPVICMSRESVDDFDVNFIDDGPYGYVNIYRQILRAVKLVTTPYVAIAEDDVLYHKSHFQRFRPEMDEFAYNRNRWSVFSWGEPIYSLRRRISNCSCIAPTKLMFEALTERYDKFNDNPPEKWAGECGRNKIERAMGITERKQVDFYSRMPIVQLSHPDATEDRQSRGRKVHAEVRAYDIPHWRRAEDLVKIYNEEN